MEDPRQGPIPYRNRTPTGANAPLGQYHPHAWSPPHRRRSANVPVEPGAQLRLSTEGAAMGVRGVLAAWRAGWWLLLAGLLVGGLAALVVSLLQRPLYTSSTELFVSASDTKSTSDVLQGSQFS